MPRAAAPIAPFGTAPLGVDQRAQVVESIGSHQTGRHQFPDSIFHFGGQQPRAVEQFAEEAGPALLETTANGLRRRAQPSSQVQPLHAVSGGNQKHRRILASKEADRRHPRRDDPPP